MKSLFNRLTTVILHFCYPLLDGRKRWFLKFYYQGKLYQLRYLIKDYIVRKPYREIKFEGEFAPELKFVLPHAYWHYKNGTLLKTESFKDTSCFYFFSKNHQENEGNRVWNDFKYPAEIPNSHDHCTKYDYSKWEQVPLKEFYSSRKIIFDKPTLVISNKFNQEWSGSPINFIDTQTLETLIETFAKSYSIIYNRPKSRHIVDDNSQIYQLDDHKIIEKYSEVLSMTDLFESSDETSFNNFQLRVYAGCNHFISVQGGNSVLTSYFGGTNIILARKGLEIEMAEYQSIYPKLSGATILHAADYKNLITVAKNRFLD